MIPDNDQQPRLDALHAHVLGLLLNQSHGTADRLRAFSESAAIEASVRSNMARDIAAHVLRGENTARVYFADPAKLAAAEMICARNGLLLAPEGPVLTGGAVHRGPWYVVSWAGEP